MSKYLARGRTVSIGDGAEPEEFTEIGHVTSISFEGSKTDADATTYDSEGEAEHVVAQRSKSLTIEGQHDPADAGQTALREQAQKFGDASVVNFTIDYPDGSSDEIPCSASWTTGGGNNDNTTFSATLTRSGADTHTEAA